MVGVGRKNMRRSPKMNSPVQKGDRHARVAEPIPRPMVLQISRGVGAEVSKTPRSSARCDVGLGESFGSCVSGTAVELVEGHALSDHVHVLLGIPPNLSVANTVGFLRGKSAIRIHREYLGRPRNFTGYHFWARGVLRQHHRFGGRGHPRLHPEAGSRREETGETRTWLIEGPFEGPSSYRPLRGR